MLAFGIFASFMCGFLLVMMFMPVTIEEERPTLESFGFGIQPATQKKKSFLSGLAVFNKPFVSGPFGQKLNRDLALAYQKTTPEEFILSQEIIIMMGLFVVIMIFPKDQIPLGIMMAFAFGYFYPIFVLKANIKKIKMQIIKELPDVVDLLALCVNAGLDFMLSLKWVVEKSPPSVMVDQLNTVLQEINVGKSRRDALRDLSKRYELPDLSTFTRTLIMADKMGTSMVDALNSLSVDMRYARFRRGETLAMQAPLKLLIPLIFFIFPVVGLLVMGPIFLNFMKMDLTTLSGKGVAAIEKEEPPLLK